MTKHSDYIADADCMKSALALILKAGSLPDGVELLKSWGAENLVMSGLAANGKDSVGCSAASCVCVWVRAPDACVDVLWRVVPATCRRVSELCWGPTARVCR